MLCAPGAMSVALLLAAAFALAGLAPTALASPDVVAPGAGEAADVQHVRESVACDCRDDDECGPCFVCSSGCGECEWRAGGECPVGVGQGEAATCGSFGRCVLDWETCVTACVFDDPRLVDATRCDAAADCPPCIQCEWGYCDGRFPGCCESDADCTGAYRHCGPHPNGYEDSDRFCVECLEDAHCPPCRRCEQIGVCVDEPAGTCRPDGDWTEGCGAYGRCVDDGGGCTFHCEFDDPATVDAQRCWSFEDCPRCHHCKWSYCERVPIAVCCESDAACPEFQSCVNFHSYPPSIPAGPEHLRAMCRNTTEDALDASELVPADVTGLPRSAGGGGCSSARFGDPAGLAVTVALLVLLGVGAVRRRPARARRA